MSEGAGARHYDVLIVGAGLSGVCAARYLQDRCPWASFALLEAREAIGGTWDLFRYPGVRSDSDMFTLGYSFRPWDSDRAIADGDLIRRYISDTAAETGIDRRILFGHRVVRADWSAAEARWSLTVERDGGGTLQLTCNFLFSCTGYYRYDRGHLPEFKGAECFGGELVHPQFWPEDLEVSGRRVVVVGSGATAVTLVPSLAAAGAQVTMLQRSPSYVASLSARSPLVPVLRRFLPRRWADAATRWLNALGLQGFYQLSRRRPELVKRILRRRLERQLPAGYDIDTHFKPRYQPWDQRMCLVPDGDLFRAISDGRASVVTDHIREFTEDGILLESGRRLEADVVVTATGLELLFLGGMKLSLDGQEVDPASRLVYKGMMLEGVPNLAVAVGYTNASWTLKCELASAYACRLLNHMRATGRQVCTPVNREAEPADAPIFGLSSGYVQRSAHLLPKQGSRFPWKVHQSYLRDWRALRLGGLKDGTMVFSGPAVSDPAFRGPAVPDTVVENEAVAG